MSTFCQNRVQCFSSVLIGACTFAQWHFLCFLWRIPVWSNTGDIFIYLDRDLQSLLVFPPPQSIALWMALAGFHRAARCLQSGCPDFSLGLHHFFLCHLWRVLDISVPHFLDLQNGETQYFEGCCSVNVQPLAKSLARKWIVSTRGYYHHYYHYDFASFLFTWNISPSLPVSSIW